MNAHRLVIIFHKSAAPLHHFLRTRALARAFADHASTDLTCWRYERDRDFMLIVEARSCSWVTSRRQERLVPKYPQSRGRDEIGLPQYA